MRTLTREEIGDVVGIIKYHYQLPKQGEGIRAVITLRELMEKHAPALEGLTLNYICAFGVNGISALEAAYTDLYGADNGVLTIRSQEMYRNLLSLYGKEGEHW